MKKSILIVHHWMELGGAEKALLGLLAHIDKNEYDVDLFLCRHSGELMPEIPEWINLLPEDKHAADIARPMASLIKDGDFKVLWGRMRGKAANKKYYKTHSSIGASGVSVTNSNRFTVKYISDINPDKTYDLAISFLTPHYIVPQKVKTKKTIAWIHTDYKTLDVDVETELSMWSAYDYIASISEACTKSFISKFPSLESKIVIIENMLSPELIRSQADVDVSDEICQEDDITTICSVGRFSEAKNYDNVPEICSNILKQGLNVRWYLIGYGGDEELIKSKIEECGVQDNVIILGKRENPYPYMKSCDIYAQPSRYEGNSVCVHEAQVLGKPVVITNYATAKDQLKDGFDGVIVPMDNESCAKGMADLINNKSLRESLSQNCLDSDYSNAHGIEVLKRIIEENRGV